MRRVCALGALLVVLLASGCSLKKNDSSCVSDPSGLGGSGATVCTKPPPTQFTQLGQ
jgi:hypothetical protein